MNSMKNKQDKKKKNVNLKSSKDSSVSLQSDIFNSVTTTSSSFASSDMTRLSQDTVVANGSHNPQFNDEDMDLHLDLEDLADYTDSDSDTTEDDGEEEFGYPPLNNKNLNTNSIELPKIKTTQNNGMLVPYNDSSALMQYVGEIDDDVEVDSEEERDIMREIREEIQQQVRKELQPELQVYKTKLKALEQGELPEDTKRQQDDKLDDVQDPKLKEAILKMRKLDRILAKKIKREKEVKRDRLSLERRVREELTAPKPDGQETNPVIKANIDKYLALAMPPSHNEGVEVSDTPQPPVFTTQLNEQDYPGVHGNQTNKSSQRSGSKDGTDRGVSPSECSELGSESSYMSGASSKKGKKKRKNFIKRNKKLAADAEKPIPMTEEEKVRIEGLLQDIDSLPELPEELDQIGDDNPFQIAVHPGEGFHPDPSELRSLIHIDSRLKNLMPPEEFESIASHTTVSTPQHRFFTPVTTKSALDFERYGDKALLENKEQRELRERLQRVEDELARLHNPDEIELDTPTLQEGELNELLDQCARSISRTSFADVDSSRCTSTENNTPRTPSSAREQLLENPPYLAPEVLQKLLTDAYCPVPTAAGGGGGNSRLSTLREEDENEEEPLTIDSISAETWKSIAEVTLDEDDMKLIAQGDLSQITARSLQYSDREQSSRNYDKKYYHGDLQEQSQDSYDFDSTNRNIVQSDSYDFDSTNRNIVQSDSYDFDSTNRNIVQSDSYDFDSTSRNLSRQSSSSSRNGLEPRFSQIPVLPKINRSGSLVSQDLNNQVNSRTSSSQSNRSSVLTVRNSFPESYVNDQDGLEIMSIDSQPVTPVPRPPSGEKQTNLTNKSRVLTPSK